MKITSKFGLLGRKHALQIEVETFKNCEVNNIVIFLQNIFLLQSRGLGVGFAYCHLPPPTDETHEACNTNLPAQTMNLG